MFLTTRLWINYLYSFTFSFIYKKMVSYTCNIYLVSMCWICTYYLRFLRFSMLINIILIKKSVLDNKIMRAVSRGMLLFLDSQLCGRCFNLSKALQCFWISIPDILKKKRKSGFNGPSKHLPVQSQQWKRSKKVWNMWYFIVQDTLKTFYNFKNKQKVYEVMFFDKQNNIYSGSLFNALYTETC